MKYTVLVALSHFPNRPSWVDMEINAQANFPPNTSCNYITINLLHSSGLSSGETLVEDLDPIQEIIWFSGSFSP